MMVGFNINISLSWFTYSKGLNGNITIYHTSLSKDKHSFEAITTSLIIFLAEIDGGVKLFMIN
jgi:hypothetical protein